jgi:hypothetical protein
VDGLEGVGFEQYQICELAGLDAPQGIGHLENARGIESSGLQRLERREASLDQPLELDVQADAGNLNTRRGQS